MLKIIILIFSSISLIFSLESKPHQCFNDKIQKFETAMAQNPSSINIARADIASDGLKAICKLVTQDNSIYQNQFLYDNLNCMMSKLKKLKPTSSLVKKFNKKFVENCERLEDFVSRVEKIVKSNYVKTYHSLKLKTCSVDEFASDNLIKISILESIIIENLENVDSDEVDRIMEVQLDCIYSEMIK